MRCLLACSCVAAVAAASPISPAPGPQSGGNPPQPTVRLDQYGDPLSPGAVQRFGANVFRVETLVEAVAFAPSGKVVAASDTPGLVHVFDAATGKEIRKLKCVGQAPGLAFSPDGKLLVARNTRGEGNVWETVSWTRVRTFPKSAKGEIRAANLIFLPGGKELL